MAQARTEPTALGYQGFLNRQSRVITGRVGMQSKFMDYGKLNAERGGPMSEE